MYQPNLQEATSFQQPYTLVPICREIYGDIMTPITLLRKIATISKAYYLLESVEGGNRWGRYSFLGFDPVVTARCRNGIVTLKGNIEKQVKTSKPLEILRTVLKDYQSPSLPEVPTFMGGFVGHFSYEMFGYAEPSLSLKKSDFNDFDLMLFDKVIAYDHLKQKIVVIANMKLAEGADGYKKACQKIDEIIELINRPISFPVEQMDDDLEFTSNLSETEFCQLVQKAQQYIFNGDIFQGVLSRRFKAPFNSSLINVYRVLRTTNPAPYMFLIQMEDVQYTGTSPETLIKLQDGKLATYPVAGTRPRGTTFEHDQALEKELLADVKELAEHNMLVDLARNDIGKISQYATVKVEAYKEIHRYSRVMHIASVVCGQIRDDKDALDAIEVMLPAGTLSGAPKIRACEIINQLEPTARGIYGGAVGYLDFAGNMDTCIAIRMAIKKDQTVYVQAGSGIVADSDPYKEYLESGNKAAAIINALKKAKEVNS